jgi:hypothetical protein
MDADRAITVRARDGTLLMTTGPPAQQWA